MLNWRRKLIGVSWLGGLLLFGSSSTGFGQIITTVAGGGVGDGGPGVQAQLGIGPGGIATDEAGHLYIADRSNHRIRRVDRATGVIITVVGTGEQGYAGDGGPAIQARIWGPIGVTIDGAGHLYFADTNNFRIRRVDRATGEITTVAGNGEQGLSDDGIPASQAQLNAENLAVDRVGNLYFTDMHSHSILRIDAVSGILASVAVGKDRLDDRSGMALDRNGNLYFSDVRDHQIRWLEWSTNLINIVGGTGHKDYAGDGGPFSLAKLDKPSGVVFDRAGNLYFSDSGNHRIRQVDRLTGLISTVVGTGEQGYSGDGGPAILAQLHEPSALTIDTADNLYFVDWRNIRIRRVDAETGLITTVAGNGHLFFAGEGGPADQAQLNRPAGMTVDAAGNLYIADFQNHRIRRIDAHTGVITTVAGSGVRNSLGDSGFSGDGGPAGKAQLFWPSDVAIDAVGNLYIADSQNERIRRVDATSGIITTIAGTGEQGYSGDGGPATLAQLNNPNHLEIDQAGHLYIAARNIRRIDAVTGIITTVLDTNKLRLSGDGDPVSQDRVVSSGDMAFDASGHLYVILHVIDPQNVLGAKKCTILRIDATTGGITTVAGSGTLGFSGDGGPALEAHLARASGLAFDPFGNLYIAEHDKHRVRRIDAVTGIITTVAGRDEPGFSGDGALATQARLHFPSGVVIDGDGNIYIADSGNDRIRKITTSTSATSIQGDFDGNGRVDLFDFFEFADAFGSTDPFYDLDGNGSVDLNDVFRFADRFGARQ